MNNIFRSTPAVRSARSLATEAGHTGGGAIGGAIDSTREFAAQALESAADKMRDLRYGMSDTAISAQRQLGRYTDATTRYVAERPMKSALIAAGVGAAVMCAVLMARRRGGRY